MPRRNKSKSVRPVVAPKPLPPASAQPPSPPKVETSQPAAPKRSNPLVQRARFF